MVNDLEKKEKIYRAVIEPVARWIGKPIPQGLAEVYVEVLGGYPENALGCAVKSVKNSWGRSTFPPAATLREAIPAQETVFKKGGGPYVCEKRQRAKQMVAEFLSKTPDFSVISIRNGWNWDLRKYLENCAAIQANILCGVRGAGYDSHCMGLDRWATAEEVRQDVRDNMSKARNNGMIRVDLPQSMINYFERKGENNAY